jgi:predicted Zn-dependent peptidase
MSKLVTRTLSCGMPLVVEVIDGVRSAAITWLVPGGCAYDPEHLQGRAALWSELLLRGSGALNSRQFADSMDRLGVSRGVSVGAYFVQVSATLLGERLSAALPLIVDVVRRPQLSPDAVEPARDLALQALESLRDDPQERAVLAARERHFFSPLNRSGLGTEEGLGALTHEALVSGWSEVARPGRSIFAAAGAIDPDALAGQLEKLLTGWEGTTPEPVVASAALRGYAHEVDQTNQVQIVLVHDAPKETDDRSWLEKIVVSVLSGGMSGRLFTEVREKRGLCYSVSAGYRGDRDFGGVTAYVGTTPERAQESLDVLAAELLRINAAASRGGGVTLEEFQRAVLGMKSRLIFSGESTAARAGAIASDYFRFGYARSLDDLAAKIDGVTLPQVNQYLEGRTLGGVTIQTLGPSPLVPPL